MSIFVKVLLFDIALFSAGYLLLRSPPGTPQTSPQISTTTSIPKQVNYARYTRLSTTPHRRNSRSLTHYPPVSTGCSRCARQLTRPGGT